MKLNKEEQKYIREKAGKLTVTYIAEKIGVETGDIREFCKENKLNTTLDYSKKIKIDFNKELGLSDKEIKFIYNNMVNKTNKELSDILGIDEEVVNKYLKIYRHNANLKVHNILKEIMGNEFNNDDEIVEYMKKQQKEKTFQEIGYELGLDKATIGKYFYDNGVRVVQKSPKTKKKITKEQIERCVEYLTEYYGKRPMDIISIELGVGTTTLHKIINTYKIERNDK